jgi:hypothetical protein
MPRSTDAASIRATIGLLGVILRGLEHRVRATEDVPTRALQRLDALWGACGSFGVMNPPIAAALAVQHLREALEAGEPTRLANALFYQAVLEAAIGGRFLRRRAAAMLALGERLADRVDDPTLRGMKHMAKGQVAWHAGEFGPSLRSCVEAIRIYDDECRGTSFHRVATENYALSALAFVGDVRALSARRRAALEWAIRRGDRFGAAIFRIGQLNLATIAEDDPERAIADADSVTASWPLRLYHHTTVTTQAELYRGAASAALARIEGAWPSLKRDGLLRLEFPRIELLHLRARAALATAARDDRRAAALARSAASWAKAIAASDLPPAAPFAASIHAGVARILGDREREAEALKRAAEGFEVAGMKLFAASYRLLLRDPGASARLEALGVVRPQLMADMLRA